MLAPLRVVDAPPAGVSDNVKPLRKFVPVIVIVWAVLDVVSVAGDTLAIVAAATEDVVGPAGFGALAGWLPQAAAARAIAAAGRRRRMWGTGTPAS